LADRLSVIHPYKASPPVKSAPDAGFDYASERSYWTVNGMDTGHVSYYAMRNSGATVFDEAGSNDGVATNDTAFASQYGIAGNGAYFDGTGDRITIADHSSLQFGTNDFTIAIWAKPPTTTSINALVSKDSTGVELYTFSSLHRAYVGNVTMTATGAPRVKAGAWQHVALTRVAGVVTLYKDGVPCSTQTITNSVSKAGTDFTIGSRGAGIYSTVAADEASFWSRGLSADEIDRLYYLQLSAPYKE